MKVLLLYDARNPWNEHKGPDFVGPAFMRAGHRVGVYGPHLEHFNENENLDEVARRYEADLCFYIRRPWTPKLPTRVPTVALVSDAHYLESVDIFEGARLLFVRASQGVKHVEALGFSGEVLWLPYSIDEGRVLPIVESRIAKVFFGGATQEHIYPMRAYALEALREAGLLVYEERQPFDRYLAQMSIYEMSLTCSSVWYLETSKHLEIPATGSLLLTDGKAPGLGRLLDPSMYLIYEPRSVVEVVEGALRNPSEMHVRAQKARKHVLQHHTDLIRGKEMVEQIEGVL